MLRLILLLIFGASTVWDGVYTDDQAIRGKASFEQNCAGCHEIGEFYGKPFMDLWGKRTAFDLFDLISTDMPKDAPGSLNKQAYAEIEAFMFKANSFPSGKTDLPSDAAALKEIQIEPKK